MVRGAHGVSGAFAVELVILVNDVEFACVTHQLLVMVDNTVATAATVLLT